jgi:hypothetical protein
MMAGMRLYVVQLTHPPKMLAFVVAENAEQATDLAVTDKVTAARLQVVANVEASYEIGPGSALLGSLSQK